MEWRGECPWEVEGPVGRPEDEEEHGASEKKGKMFSRIWAKVEEEESWDIRLECFPEIRTDRTL